MSLWAEAGPDLRSELIRPRWSGPTWSMSLPPKADIRRMGWHVR